MYTGTFFFKHYNNEIVISYKWLPLWFGFSSQNLRWVWGAHLHFWSARWRTCAPVGGNSCSLSLLLCPWLLKHNIPSIPPTIDGSWTGLWVVSEWFISSALTDTHSVLLSVHSTRYSEFHKQVDNEAVGMPKDKHMTVTVCRLVTAWSFIEGVEGGRGGGGRSYAASSCSFIIRGSQPLTCDQAANQLNK